MNRPTNDKSRLNTKYIRVALLMDIQTGLKRSPETLSLSVRILYDKCVSSIKNSSCCHGSDRPNGAALVDSYADITAAMTLILALEIWNSTDG